MTTAVGSALCVCVLISVAFIGYLTQSNLGVVVAVLFIAAMGLLVFSRRRGVEVGDRVSRPGHPRLTG